VFKFYVHYNIETLAITSVSATHIPEEGQAVLNVDEEFGNKVMLGTENILNYEIFADAGKIELRKKNIKPPERLFVPFYAVKKLKDDDCEVTFSIDKKNNVVKVEYDVDSIKVQRNSAKFYITRFDDPAVLKVALHLEVNSLNKLFLEKLGLKEWPNPIRIQVDDASDISIFGIRGQIKATLK
jgi:hypothetical protein